MKLCCRCKQFKDESEFGKRSSRTDGLSIHCLVCKREIANRSYRRNPCRNKERNRRRAFENRVWLQEFLKDKRCEWEGCDVTDPDMLTFDHLDRSKKRKTISYMVQNGFSINTIIEEIGKCRILCCNHHMKYSIEQLNWRRYVKY
jgi:hypothetical protein